MATRKAKRTGAPRTPRPSLRSWLERLEGAGELRRVKAEVGWDEEIGALMLGLPRDTTDAAIVRHLKYGTGKGTRVLIDATRNWEFEPNPAWGNRRYPPINTIPVALERKIRERWHEYGLGIEYDAQGELPTR